MVRVTNFCVVFQSVKGKNFYQPEVFEFNSFVNLVFLKKMPSSESKIFILGDLILSQYHKRWHKYFM